MCKNGKIVIFACEAAGSQNMLMEFSRSIGVRILGNQGTVSIANRLVLQNYITHNYSLARGTYILCPTKNIMRFYIQVLNHGKYFPQMGQYQPLIQ